MTSPRIPSTPGPISREDFEKFLHAFTHEIRNRLNGIALEAVDVAEQAGEQVDASRLQRQVQECAVFLKTTRDLLAPGETETAAVTLEEFLRRLRERKV